MHAHERGSQSIKHDFVNVTPTPILSGFKRLDDRMAGRVKVTRRMLVGRRIATPNVPTGHAKTQVNPRGADAQTVFTTTRARRDGLNLIKMRTNFFHGVSVICVICG